MHLLVSTDTEFLQGFGPHLQFLLSTMVTRESKKITGHPLVDTKIKSLSTRHGPEIHTTLLVIQGSSSTRPWPMHFHPRQSVAVWGDCSKTRPMVPVPGSSHTSHEAQRFLLDHPSWCTHGVFGTDIMDRTILYIQVKPLTSYPPLTFQDPTQQGATAAHTLQAAWSWNQPRILVRDPHGAPVVSDRSLRPEMVAVASATVSKS